MLFLFWMWPFEVLKSTLIDKHVDIKYGMYRFHFPSLPMWKKKKKKPDTFTCMELWYDMSFDEFFLYNSRWMKNYTYVKAFKSLLLPQINGCACVDFSYTHPIDGLFWSLPIYLLSFFSKYQCWVTDLIMPLYHFILFGLSFSFLYHEVSYHYEMWKKFVWLNFKMKFVW